MNRARGAGSPEGPMALKQERLRLGPEDLAAIERDTAQELCHRSRAVALGHSLLALLLFLISGWVHDHASLLTPVVGAFLLAGLVRMWVIRRFARMYERHSRRWRRMFAASVLATGALWAAFSSITYVMFGATWTSYVTIVAIAGIASTAVTSLPNGPLVRAFVVVVTMPGALTAGLVIPEVGPAIATMLVLFLVITLKTAAQHTRAFRESLIGNRLLHAHARTLEEAVEASAVASSAKDQFLANVSHEIRTPLNGIMGHLELLGATGLDTEQRQHVAAMEDAADTLLSTVERVLDFTSAEAGTLEVTPGPFGLRDFLQELVRSLSPRAHAHGLDLVYRVSLDVPDALIGDVRRVRQALMHLLDNAIKFTREGHIELNVAVDGWRDGQVELSFSVLDTGVGVSAEKEGLIFEAFTQADGRSTREAGGIGLGLTVSGEIARLLGGHIRLEHRRPRGSAFILAVPFTLGSRSVLPASTRSSTPIHGASILVFEPSRLTASFLRDTLHSWDVKPTVVATFEDAIDALHRATRAPFRAAIIDVEAVPVTEVANLIGALRLNGGLDRSAVQLVTSRRRGGELAWTSMLGGATLEKPVRRSELFDALTNALAASITEEEDETPCEVPLTRHVLLVEDNRVNQLIAARLLEREGYEVSIANTGLEAVEKVGRFDYDAILMDLSMPEMDGFEATAVIREQERRTGGHVPIVALTAHALKQDRERCLAAGMDAHVAKPIRPDVLFATLASVLGASAGRRDPGDAIERAA